MKIQFYGGFHNSGHCNVIAGEKYRDSIKNRELHPEEFLSVSQAKRLSRHFCGIKGYMCGGPYRANWEIIN